MPERTGQQKPEEAEKKERDWTPEQEHAFTSPSRKIICSAAAGSGKTAVMIERVIRMLREGADPESFLVVTFTNAAAAEMKQKIRDRLRKGRHEEALRRALEKIDLMEISTIHSFCQRLIRQEFQAADADPFFTVCEPVRAARLFGEAFRSACASLQREEDPDYFHWKKCYTARDTEEIIRSVYTFMMSLPDPFEWLDRSCDNVPLQVDPSHPWFETASRIVREKLMTAQVILRRQFLMFEEPEHGEPYRDVWKADSELFHVKQLWADGQEVPDEQMNAGFMRMPSWSRLNSLEAAWKERYQKYREELKDIMKEIIPLIRPDENLVRKEYGNMRVSLQGLKKITRRTAENFEKKKAKLRVLDFHDLEHRALRILSEETVGAAVRGRYREIFVDECQDVSRVQDELVQRLASPAGHLFMVGDVKQSIYRFRLADPELFLRRSRQYDRPDTDGELVELQTNFRSRPEILKTANTVFRDVMRLETAELDYTDREELRPGRKAEGPGRPVYADVILPDPEKTKLESIADYVAVRSAELRKEGLKYRDMVILMPQVSRDGQKLAGFLEDRGVPVFFDGGGDFLERREIGVFLQLLTCVNNPFLDEPLLVSLKNAPFFFTEEELAEVRLKNDGKDVPFREAFRLCALEDGGVLGDRCREADGRLREWRKLASVMQMSDFVRYLCSDSHQYAMAGIQAAGKTAQRNLRILCRRAEEAEKNGLYSLRRFLAYVSEQAGGGDRNAPVSLADEDDVIRIMTMHKSKGLQFPVVFCLGLDNDVSHAAGAGAILDADLGICLKYKKPEYRISRPTGAAKIFQWKKEREERAERIRLLYVAMTRAQERMFLAAVGEDSTLWQTPAGVHRVLSAKTYMDWIMPALMDDENLSTSYTQPGSPWKIRLIDNNQQPVVEKKGKNPQFGEWLDSLLSSPPVEGLWKEQPSEPYVSRMQKKSVTSLLRQAEKEIADAEGDEETPEGKRFPDSFSEALRRTEIAPMPSFMAPPPEKRGAWRGTVVHRFLSLVDLDRIRAAGADPVPELERMREEMLSAGIFTGEEAAVIRPEDAAAYLLSPLGARMLASPEVRREWGFNLYRPERNMLVQGIIDCAFREKDGWILVDYKTDRVEDTEAFRRVYSPQLKWYAEALRDLTGLEVRESWLYSISRKEALIVEDGGGPGAGNPPA